MCGKPQREDEESSVIENDAKKGLFSIPLMALPRFTVGGRGRVG